MKLTDGFFLVSGWNFSLPQKNIHLNLDITTIIIIEGGRVIMGGKIHITAKPVAIHTTAATATGITSRNTATAMTGEREWKLNDSELFPRILQPKIS